MRAKTEGVGVAPITELLMTSFEIVKVTIQKGLEYTTAIVTVKDGGKYRTSSDVLLEQLLAIQRWLSDEDVDAVNVHLKQVGRYYTF